jgi:sodium-independent sulfate anion transporter 11
LTAVLKITQFCAVYYVHIFLLPQVGLLSSVIGGIIYTFFGTVKEISIGPTAMMSLMTDQYTSEMLIDNIGTLCFGCAIVGLTLTVFRLG